MLFQPSFILPSTLSGEGSGTIDATEALTVSWQVNGNPATLYAYQIVIYQNTATSTEMYDTGKVSLSPAFEGIDNLGNPQYFSATPITAATLATAGIVNGYANGYKLLITQWYGTGENDYITQSSAAAFVTRATPTLTIDAFTSPLPYKSYSFSATYTQEQGDSLSWVRWYIANATNTTSPLLDTGNIYGTSVLSVGYDGFFSGRQYVVRCVVQTENGVRADTGWVQFFVSYALTPMSGSLTACKSATHSGVLLQWTLAAQINGVATGSYSIRNGTVSLPLGSSITWNEVNGDTMSFTAPYTIAWKGNITSAGGVMFSALIGTSLLRVSIVSGAATVTLGTSTLATIAIPADIFGWWTAIVTPTNIYLQRIETSGALYPDTTLYPETTLYPSNSTVTTILTYSAALSYTQSPLSGLTIYGNQVCQYLWATGVALPSATINAIMASETYEPSWDSNTDMLALFLSGIGAGNSDSVAYSLYRLQSGKTVLEKVCDLPASVQTALDCGTKSQTEYTYYLFPSREDSYTSQPLISNAIAPLFWDWTVLETEFNNDGTYHILKEYPFSINVSSGSISNNNNPNIMHNFTPYPTVQTATANYRSGTLNAYLGSVDQTANRYIDTVEQANAVMALSSSTNPLFLKNRKGDLWMIRIAGATTMTTQDLTRPQAQVVGLPWVEVASTSGISIISLPTDAAWDI